MFEGMEGESNHDAKGKRCVYVREREDFVDDAGGFDNSNLYPESNASNGSPKMTCSSRRSNNSLLLFSIRNIASDHHPEHSD